jgi:hypothetical protein
MATQRENDKTYDYVARQSRFVLSVTPKVIELQLRVPAPGRKFAVGCLLAAALCGVPHARDLLKLLGK